MKQIKKTGRKARAKDFSIKGIRENKLLGYLSPYFETKKFRP